MTPTEKLNLWIQSAVAVAAVAAAVIALIVSAMDRANARSIAAEDRRVSLEQARLLFDLDVLVRLSQNLERAGHVDPQTSRDMGAEAAALVNVIGPERLPITWEAKRKNTLDEARTFMSDPTTPSHKRHAIEVLLEAQRVGDRIAELIKSSR